MLIGNIILLVFLLMLSAFFSGVEVALVSVGKIELRSWFKQKKKGARALKKLKSKPRGMITTILIGNNIVNIWASALATIIATDAFGSKGAGIAVGLMTFLVLIFGEITPKAYAATHYESISLFVARPILLLRKALGPVVWFFNNLSGIMLKLFGGSSIKNSLTEEQLKVAFEIGVEENIIDKEEKQLLKNVLAFDDITAEEVMTGKRDMFVLDANMKVKDAVDVVSKSQFSRFPLYEGKKTNIVGVIHLKDLLEAVSENEQDLKIREIGVLPIFIPVKLKVDDILRKFQETHRHIAIVVNKRRTVMGLVTIEDLLEEIVGEIIDESDVSPNYIMRLDNKTILVDGETTPYYLKSFFRLSIPKKFNTLSDYLIKKCHGLPARNLTLDIGRFSYFIEEVGEDHIERVVITRRK